MLYLGLTNFLFLLRYALSGRGIARIHFYYLVVSSLFLFSAFRFQVGCDWFGYYSQYVRANNVDWSTLTDIREPIWWAILAWIYEARVPYPVINIVSSAVFFAGIHVLARRQPDPLGFLVLLFPVLIINMPMSGIRQGAAVGLLCVALVSFIDRKPVWCAFWIVVASGFHSSAAVFLILLPLATGSYTRSRILLSALLALPGVYLLASGDAAEIAVDRYVGTGVDAAGAAFRVGVLFLSGLFFFLILRRSWRRQFPEDFPLAHLFSMAMMLLIGLVPLSSVIGDRLGYYLIPVQAMIFARIPYLDIRHRKIMTVLPYLGLALMFTAWVAMSYQFQQCYLPYQSWIFGFPNSSWSGL